jgi:hypothetical protein
MNGKLYNTLKSARRVRTSESRDYPDMNFVIAELDFDKLTIKILEEK